MSMLNMLLGIGGSGTVSTLDIVDPFLDKSGVALYKMDGNAQDAGGLYNGTPTNMSYTSGKFGDCGVFNQSNISVGDNFDIGLNSISFSFWLKTTSLSSDQAIFTKSLYGGLRYRYWCSLLTNGKIEFYMEASSGVVTTATSTQTLAINTWAHVCIILNRTGNLEFYINEAKTTSISLSDYASVNFQTTCAFTIGSYNTAGGVPSATTMPFYGSIDQFRIFNRALTKEEVTALYNEGQ